MDQDQQHQSSPVVSTEMPQTSMHPAVAIHPDNSAQKVLNDIRRKVLQIIGIISVLSALSVLGIYALSIASDDALIDRVDFSNDHATYEVPATWQESVSGSVSSYINGVTTADSQVNMVIIAPQKATFNSAPLTEDEILQILREYESIFNLSDESIRIEDRREIDMANFNRSYEYDIVGSAADGLTSVSGLARIAFDQNNYIHTVEIVAVTTYWDANTEQLRDLVDTYKLKAGE